MIQRRSNVFSGASRVTHNDSVVCGRPVPISALGLFRTLWRRRGTWISEQRLAAEFSLMKEFRFELRRLRMFFKFDLNGAGTFTIEEKVEPDEHEVPFTYYRLVTPETLPEAAKLGLPALAETLVEPTTVPLSEIPVDRLQRQ